MFSVFGCQNLARKQRKNKHKFQYPSSFLLFANKLEGKETKIVVVHKNDLKDLFDFVSVFSFLKLRN